MKRMVGSSWSQKGVIGNSPIQPNRGESPSAVILEMICQGDTRIGKAPGRFEGKEVMKRLQYLVRVNKDAGSDWGASVPDLPGCVATGKTVDAALRRIERAIELHIRGMREDGQKPPRPSHRTVTPRRTPRRVDFFATVEVAA